MMKTWITNNWVWALTLAVVTLVGGMFLLRSQSSSATSETLETITITREDFQITVDSIGVVEPLSEVQLTFGANGTVSEVMVEVGDRVESGDPLAQLDTQDLAYQVELAEIALTIKQTNYDDLFATPTDSEVAKAQAAVISAEATLTNIILGENVTDDEIITSCAPVERARQDWQQAQADYADYVSEGYQMDATFAPDPSNQVAQLVVNTASEFERVQAQCNISTNNAQDTGQRASAEANLISAQATLTELLGDPTSTQISLRQADLNQAQIQLEQAQNALDGATLSAPFDGMITAVQIVPGQTISSSLAVITLVDSSQLQITIEVDEIDIPQVTLGQEAALNIEAFDGIPLSGEVTRIAPAANSNQGLVTYDVQITLAESDNAPIRIGMTADAEITVRILQDVLAVPTRAIQRDGDTEYIEIQANTDTTHRIDIQPGVSQAGLTVIESGEVEAGMVVVIPALESTNSSDDGGGFGPPFLGG